MVSTELLAPGTEGRECSQGVILARARREIAAIEAEIRAGNPDLYRCRAFSDGR